MAVTSLAGSFQVSFGILHLYSAGKRPHRLVVRTSRRGRDNPGSTPGVDISRADVELQRSVRAPCLLRAQAFWQPARGVANGRRSSLRVVL